VELTLEQILVVVAGIQLSTMGYPQGYWLRTEVEQVSMPTAIEHGSAGPEASGNVVVHKPKFNFRAALGACARVALSVGIAERVTIQSSGAKLDPSSELLERAPTGYWVVETQPQMAIQGNTWWGPRGDVLSS
jgi:hypothetical protein